MGIVGNKSSRYWINYGGGGQLSYPTSLTTTLSESPNWMALNKTTNKIYVSDDAGSPAYSIALVNAANLNFIGYIFLSSAEINVIAANPSTNKIYAAGASNTLYVIDGSTDTLKTTVAVGDTPFGVAINSITNRIYVINEGVSGTGQGTVTVIDGSNDTVITTINVGSSTGIGSFVSVNPNTNKIYASVYEDGIVAVIDGKTNTVIKNITVGNLAFGSSINTITNKIYVINLLDNTVSVIDGNADVVTATVTIPGASSDLNGISANPNNNRTYVAFTTGGSANYVTVIKGSDYSTYTVTAPFNSIRNILVDPTTDVVYVDTAQATGTIGAILSQ